MTAAHGAPLAVARPPAAGRAIAERRGRIRSEIANDLRVLAEEKGQSLSVESARAVTTPIDRSLLRHAVSNVLHNAVRYAPEGGRIAVTVGRDDMGSPFVEIADDGPGIPPADRERVFDRFYRIGDARSRADGGTGLGLAIARWAMEAHGGSIEFRDAGQPGCRCRMTIRPAAAAARELDAESRSMVSRNSRFWAGVTAVLSLVAVAVGFPAFLRMFGMPAALAWTLAVVGGVWLTYVLRAWAWSSGSGIRRR